MLEEDLHAVDEIVRYNKERVDAGAMRGIDLIRVQIEQARDALAVTLDELGTRANPQRFVESGKESVRAKLDEPKIRYSLIAVAVLVGFALLRKLFR